MRKPVRSVQGVIRSLTPARSLPRLRALVQRVRDALQPAVAKPADPRKVRFEELEPRLLMSVAPGADPVLFVPGFGGSFAADTSTAGVAEWFTTIGLDPGKLALEPLGNVYQSFAQTLENVGYSLNQNYLSASARNSMLRFITSKKLRPAFASSLSSASHGENATDVNLNFSRINFSFSGLGASSQRMTVLG